MSNTQQMSNSIKEKSIDWQGHRGARGLLPENTIPAFIKALEYPVTTLELDVAISKDKKVIVTHEPWFNHKISSHPDGKPILEKEEKNILIYEMTYKEIKKYDVGSRGNERFPDQQPMKVFKPSLNDLVKAVDEYCEKTGRTKPNFDIEIKSEEAYYGKLTPHPEEYVRLVLETCKATGIENRCNLQSFDIDILEEINQQNPSMVVAYLIDNEDLPEDNLKKITFKPNIYSPYFKLLSKEVIDRMHKKNIKVIPWTVNEKEDMKKMIEIGVDGIITDYPNYIEAVISSKK
ncbi:MAG: glycerophosphodiester phosphodiesterase family protein [Saprospiraceae bacterium]